jgi:hypothetical protein
MPQLKRIVVIALLVLGSVSGFSWVWLDLRYDATRPPHPDPPAGRVYELNNHGSYVYLTADENMRLQLLGYGSWPLFVAAFFLSRLWNVTFDPFEKFPDNIRRLVRRGPRHDYANVRSTYRGDKESDDGA